MARTSSRNLNLIVNMSSLSTRTHKKKIFYLPLHKDDIPVVILRTHGYLRTDSLSDTGALTIASSVADSYKFELGA